MNDILKYSVGGYAIFNLTFWVTSGVCAILDYVGITRPTSQRMQSYGKSLVVSVTNTLIGTIPAFFLLGCYEYTFSGEECSLIDVVYQIGVIRLLSEVFFFGMHFLLHQNPFYTTIHKLHHQITAPVGITAIYMSMWDLYLGNIAPLYLPVVIIGACPLSLKIWMIGSTISAVIAHSGLIKSHDLHHSHSNVNYGTSLFMDKVMGTERV